LTPEDLVIADEAGPIALAGVMGGEPTKVTESTTRVLLESALTSNLTGDFQTICGHNLGLCTDRSSAERVLHR